MCVGAEVFSIGMEKTDNNVCLRSLAEKRINRAYKHLDTRQSSLFAHFFFAVRFSVVFLRRSLYFGLRRELCESSLSAAPLAPSDYIAWLKHKRKIFKLFDFH
jgi:hypothetical protein